MKNTKIYKCFNDELGIEDLKAKLQEEDLRVRNEFLKDKGIKELKENQELKITYTIECGVPNKKETELLYYDYATCDNLNDVYKWLVDSLKILEWGCNRKSYNDAILPCVVIWCDYDVVNIIADELIVDSDHSYDFNPFEIEPRFHFDVEEVKEEILDSINTNYIIMPEFEEKLKEVFDGYYSVGDFNKEAFDIAGTKIQDMANLIDEAISKLKAFCNDGLFDDVLTKDYIKMFDKVIGKMFDEFEKENLVGSNDEFIERMENMIGVVLKSWADDDKNKKD